MKYPEKENVCYDSSVELNEKFISKKIFIQFSNIYYYLTVRSLINPSTFWLFIIYSNLIKPNYIKKLSLIFIF